jgi:uncharacterized membrane protein YGL010W
MKTGLDQLSNYAAYHRDRRNIATHLVGVPMIVFAVVVLLSRPTFSLGDIAMNPAWVVMAVVGLYYLKLDLMLGSLLVGVLALMGVGAQSIADHSPSIWLQTGIGLFVLGWIIQFIGHHFEGRKPAFVDDLVGLLIGPMFVLAEVLFALGLRKPLQEAIEDRVGPTIVRSKTASLQ